MTVRAYAPMLFTLRPCGIVGAVCVCVCMCVYEEDGSETSILFVYIKFLVYIKHIGLFAH